MLKEHLERSLLLSIGLLSLTREKAQRVVDEMVKQGSAAREEAKELTEKLVQRGEEERRTVRKMIREEVNQALHDLNLATADEVAELRAELAALRVECATQAAQEESATS